MEPAAHRNVRRVRWLAGEHLRLHPPERIAGQPVRPDWPSYAPFNMLGNLSGLPVATLPVRLTDGGLPVGALLFANPGQEALLLSALAQAETLRGPLAPPLLTSAR